MPEIVIATNNKGKLIEIKSLLTNTNMQVRSPTELGLNIDVKEVGSTYQENAALKAKAFADASGMVVLADDSGLEVEALEGAPGLYSARYSTKPDADDSDRRLYLLEQLSVCPPPWKAQFRCVVALTVNGKSIHFTEGICPGEIIPVERGSHGFGYDPIFLIPQVKRTMAELTLEEKNKLSHRALAVQKAIPLLIELLAER